ncbi:DUF4235 domain-containing protein [Rhodopirellula sp. MGV]|uniref:DUF4235 domain-containing protein n=1 Tax=Rhodopirellula sp. MGV TaxID=2023130 RepID=UPI000B979F2A|nr:DUF4235 domain-containing protein [Rhodopirellula sp. MGV]OYP28885.1 hypothetical protein CGZ80_25285 [Rhodopirellula sp. MGV]PNY36998.1 DUF4235 domain-containing protein [Rhodopirellula baltica]
MIDELKEHAQNAKAEFNGRVLGHDEPNGRNVGVGPTENLLAYAAAIAATFAARQALQASWRTALDREPPKNPSSPEVDWKDALLWGAVSGAIVGMVRIASRRSASAFCDRMR